MPPTGWNIGACWSKNSSNTKGRPAAGRLTGRSIGVLVVKSGPAHFEPLADLCVADEVAIHIDRTFTLDEVPAALAHVGEGRALGKVVVVPS